MSKNHNPEAAIHARELLAKYITPNTPIYAYLENISPSGMTKRVRVFVLDESGHPLQLAGPISILMGRSYHDRTNSIIVKGAGFNACYDVVQDVEQACGYEPRTLTWHQV